MSRRIFRIVALCALTALSGCGNAPGINPLFIRAADAQGADTAHRSVERPYMLRPNDQLRVQVYNEPSISGDYQVDGAGYISVPLAGRIKASGRTAGQLERAIVAALSRGMLKDPRVNVQVSNYAAFYIHGEVKKSGEYPYRPRLTVMDAVATAGGFTYRADESKAVVRRAGDNVDSVVPLDRTISVSPGDNIKIPERFF
ncbi:MAG: polysaccharide biosynthesis/export family protein [Variibacter sp.]